MAIIAAIVTLLNTLSVVLGVDLGGVIAEIEKFGEDREDGGWSAFAPESEQSDMVCLPAAGQKRHRRQHRGKPGKHPRSFTLEPVTAELEVTSLPGVSGFSPPGGDQWPQLPPPAPVAAKADSEPAVERQRPALAHEVRAAE